MQLLYVSDLSSWKLRATLGLAGAARFKGGPVEVLHGVFSLLLGVRQVRSLDRSWKRD